MLGIGLLLLTIHLDLTPLRPAQTTCNLQASEEEHSNPHPVGYVLRQPESQGSSMELIFIKK